MERYVAIACVHQGVASAGGKVAVHHDDIQAPFGCRADRFERSPREMTVDRLQYQRRSLCGAEGAAECIDQADRILAVDVAEKVEHEEKDEPCGEAEVGPT